MFDEAKRFMEPLIERNKINEEFRALPQDKKIELIKYKYRLAHGKGKRKCHK